VRAFALAGLCLAALAQAAPVPYQATFEAVAGARWKDRAAQVRQESRFNPRAVSPVGARGLAQFMPGTWAWAQAQGWVAPGASPVDVEPALRAQHRYMDWLEARCAGQWAPALGAYNAGLGSVRKAQLAAQSLGLEGADAWLRALPRVTHAHAAETQAYVRQIRQFRLEMGA
jgi:soluble lytic murein transglycosylase-like protein